jgi:hypothetical protein
MVGKILLGLLASGFVLLYITIIMLKGFLCYLFPQSGACIYPLIPCGFAAPDLVDQSSIDEYTNH